MKDRNPPDHLRPRLQAVAWQVAQGKCNKDIAAALGISPNTVKIYMVEIMRRLNLQNRLAVALWALRELKDMNKAA